LVAGNFYVYVDNVEDPDFCVRATIKRMSRMLESETPEGLSGSKFMEQYLAPRLMEAMSVTASVTAEDAAGTSARL
jgi:hypothetical protein